MNLLSKNTYDEFGKKIKTNLNSEQNIIPKKITEKIEKYMDNIGAIYNNSNTIDKNDNDKTIKNMINDFYSNNRLYILIFGIISLACFVIFMLINFILNRTKGNY
jgi:hypothetical protein